MPDRKFRRIASLRNNGERLIAHFDARYGNPHIEEEVFFDHHADEDHAVFRYPDGNDTFTVYRLGGRWCYGTSADGFRVFEPVPD